MFHETLEEQLSRVDLMVSDDSKSDLSEYERDALRAVILELRIISHAFLALKEKEDATQQSYERVSELAENLTATLRAIRDANYREWEELATPDEFVKWAQSIARAAVSSVLPSDRSASSGQSQIPQAENQEASGYHWA
jgi:hypothetical protein